MTGLIGEIDRSDAEDEAEAERPTDSELALRYDWRRKSLTSAERPGISSGIFRRFTEGLDACPLASEYGYLNPKGALVETFPASITPSQSNAAAGVSRALPLSFPVVCRLNGDASCPAGEEVERVAAWL